MRKSLVAILGTLSFTAVLALAWAAPSATVARDRDGVPSIARPAPRHTAIPRASGEATSIVAEDPGPRRVRVPRGLLLPISGAAIPEESELLPEALRDYRGGVHEGIDFAVAAGTPVLAVADGTVVRADRDFVDWSDEERARALEEARALGYTPEPTLDRIRGRQVWIDHGRGAVSRYAHLAGVAPLVIGQTVRVGEAIGNVGSSGYPEGGPHLHFEVRLGESYLGDGLTPAQLARALRDVFR